MSVRIGLVGYGRRGQRLLDRLVDIKLTRNFEISGVYDIDKNKKAFLPENIKWYDDFFNLLDDSNVLIIATSPSSHYNLAKIALEKNLDILVEKPSTLKYEHDLDLENRSKKQGRILAVGYSERFNPVVKIAKNEINFTDTFLYYTSRINWLQPKGENPGIEFDLISHDIDMGYYYFNKIPASKYLMRDDYISMMNLKYGHINSTLVGCIKNGIGYRSRIAEIYSENKIIEINYSEQEITILEGPKIPEEWKKDFHKLKYEEILHVSHNRIRSKHSFEHEPLKDMLECFISSIEKGEIIKPLCSISEAKIVTKTIEDSFKLLKL